VSASGSDAGRCTQAAPCASFDRAFRAARPGEVVEVAGGSYPPQVLTADGRTSGPNVVFRPASGARVRLAGLDFGSGGEAAHGPDFITVRRMETTYKATEPGAGNQEGVFVGPGSTHIELESMDVGSVSTWLAEHVTVRGGDIGPCQPTPNAPLVCNNNHIDASKHVLFSGVDIHDYRFDESCWSDGADCHWECMYINGGENVTITRSRFRGCAIFDIFTTISGDDAARMGHRNLRIVNNWFAAPWHETASGSSQRSTAVSVAWCQNSPHGYQDLFIGFNSFQRNANVMVDQNPACVFDDVRIVGNLMMYDACQSRWTWAYNVFSTAWRTGKCSSTDRIAGSQFPYVRGSGDADMDYHLAGPSVADDLVPVSQGCPAVDFDGQSRPVSGSCDAGADER
jgi:hypothetical protein